MTPFRSPIPFPSVYLSDLGINAIWLSPCYKSPNHDNGYDISDYRDIMDEFGTLADWERLIAEAHRRGIKLIMDLVANHTSDEHYWFREARKSRDNPYHDYYWAEKPKNDWKACFGGSAWEYNEPTGEYYLHSFAVQQPDLNWENPRVRAEMCAVVDYWVGKGVDGFRCDVLDYISKISNREKCSTVRTCTNTSANCSTGKTRAISSRSGNASPRKRTSPISAARTGTS